MDTSSRPASIHAENPGTAPGTLARHGLGCVLVVEDDDAVRNLVARALPRLGFNASAAGNGTEALVQLRSNPDSYALILLDFKLPGMTSAELVQEVRRIRQDLPVIIMTGYDRDKAMESFSGMNIAGYIHKPFTLTDLASEIRNSLGS